MPTYLRWIASITAGITAYFVYAFASFGIAKATGHTSLHGLAGGMIAFGAYLVSAVSVLAINDWLARQYPKPVVTASDEVARDPEPAER